MSATLPILTALQNHLQTALPGYEVALFPDRPEAYRFIHPKGAVLIGYQGSKFTRLESLGMMAQQRDITLNLTVFGRGLHHDGAALDLLDALRLALVGYTPPNCLPCHLLAEVFLSEDAGAWQYQLTAQTETQQVEQITQPDLAKFIQARTRRRRHTARPRFETGQKPTLTPGSSTGRL